MIIAVDTRVIANDAQDNFASFVYKSIVQLAEESPKNQFIFFTDEIIKTTAVLPANVSHVIVSPKVNNWLKLKWWYEVKMPAALKKHKASLLICAGNTCSLRTKVPQVLILDDYHKLNKKYLAEFYLSKRRLSASLKFASIICTSTQHAKEEYCKAFKIEKEKVVVTGIVTLNNHKPIIWEEREKVKEKYAAGCEYFFCDTINDNQFIPLLKAFSIFKKWQKSNMKLVFYNFSKHKKSLAEKIANYKHRNELFFYENTGEDDYNALMSSAYAIIHFSAHQLFSLLKSIQLEVPILALQSGNTNEIINDAGLYFESINPEQIAEKMKIIFKDEQLRNNLIQKGKERAYLFSQKNVMNNLQQAIQMALNN